MALSTKPPEREGTRVRRPSPTDLPTNLHRPSIVADKPSRSERARAYEEKVAGILNLAMRVCAVNEGTVSDAAAFIEHGPALASKLGDLAAHDQRVRHGIDIITSGTDNPYAAVIVAALPLVSQLVRNHEMDSAKPFEIKIPFTKRTFKPKIKIRLNAPVLRALTTAPGKLIERVFGDPDNRAALITQGIDVALPEYRNASERHAS